MKKLLSVSILFLGFLFVASTLKAQVTQATFYAGKWDVFVKGIPQGDTHMIFTVVEKEGKLSGTRLDPETKKELPLTSVEMTDKGVTLYFSAQGYDVDIALQKKDDDHLTGMLMNMFESNAERVK
ncbi:MAG: hypothetical protein NVSMB45_13760 [Ginsengibacter sp.]